MAYVIKWEGVEVLQWLNNLYTHRQTYKGKSNYNSAQPSTAHVLNLDWSKLSNTNLAAATRTPSIPYIEIPCGAAASRVFSLLRASSKVTLNWPDRKLQQMPLSINKRNGLLAPWLRQI